MLTLWVQVLMSFGYEGYRCAEEAEATLPETGTKQKT